MSFIRYYLDKPYNPSIPKEELNKIIAAADKLKKQYPKRIFNPRLTTLYLYFTYAKGKRLKAKTQIKIKGEHWNVKEGQYRSQILGSLELNNELNDLSNSILKNFSRFKEGKTQLSDEDISNLVKSIINKDEIFTSNTIEKCKTQFFIKKSNILTEGTLKEYRTVFKSLKEYQEINACTLQLDDFSQGFFNDYEQFLVNRKNPYDPTRGLLNDTIAKYVSTLKSFLFWCHESGYIANVDHFHKIKTKIKKRSKNEIVVLTEQELMQLYEFDFSDNTRLERARDLFCFACFTGQRFSDVLRFSRDDMEGNMWVFTSYKSKKKVVVPFEGFIRNALPILEKYKYVLPEISNQKLNEYLKELGEIAGLNKNEKIIRFSGVKELIIKNPKFKFMSSHMGRRTFVTIMLEKGVPITMVQKLTQHSDLRTLLKYESHSQNTLINSLKTT